MDDRAHQLLKTSARVIDEDETYAVVAVRIRKSAIAENLLLLGVLCDLVPKRVPAKVGKKRPVR